MYLLTSACFHFADAVLAARTSMFSLLNFKAVFGLAFARICVSLLQAVVAFHDMQMRTGTETKERQLEACIFVFAVLKIIACYMVRSLVPQGEPLGLYSDTLVRHLSIRVVAIIVHRTSEAPTLRGTRLVPPCFEFWHTSCQVHFHVSYCSLLTNAKRHDSLVRFQPRVTDLTSTFPRNNKLTLVPFRLHEPVALCNLGGRPGGRF